MDLEKFERDITTKYAKKRSTDLNKKVSTLFEHIEKEWEVATDDLDQAELKIIAEAVVTTETKQLHDEVQLLLAEKERIERELDRKRDALQKSKYLVFDALEHALGEEPSSHTLAKLHHIKLQSIDLFDMLEEMVESAIITTLEKGHDIEETIEEIIKDITYETLNEGPLSSIRIRKVIASIVGTATSMADAAPNRAEMILRGTLLGIRSGLTNFIGKFKKQLLYMPEETKIQLTDGFDSLQDELQHADTLFTQIVQNVAASSSSDSKTLLQKITQDIHYDLQELVQISKETVEIMRSHLSGVIKSSNKVLVSERALEAKRIGIQAWSAAKTAVSGAIKTAKGKIDKN